MPVLLYTAVKAILRTIWIAAANLYSAVGYIIIMAVTRPLLWVAPDLYWQMEGYIFRWQLMIVAHWLWSAGYTVSECGDDVSMCTEEECLVTSNHMSTGDVPTLMQSLSHKGVTNRLCWILDEMFKYSHFGWVCKIRGDIFIKQGRDTRHLQAAMLSQHMKEVYWSRGRQWIVVFPEGGFLKNRKLSSQAYAKKHDLPELEHVTFPRVGAIQSIMEVASPAALKSNGVIKTVGRTRPIKWFIDITIGYPQREPLDMLAIVGGWREPCNTQLYFRKYPIEQVPVESDALTAWIYDRFIEKEELLKTLYATGSFPNSSSQGDTVTPKNQKKLQWTNWQLIPPHLFYIAICYLASSYIYAGFAAFCMPYLYGNEYIIYMLLSSVAGAGLVGVYYAAVL